MFFEDNIDNPGLSMQRVPFWLIVAAFAVGGWFAWLRPVEQDATTAALTVVGIIPIQPASVMGHFYIGSWTLLNQLGAGLLATGLSQTAVDYFYCIAVGGIQLGGHAMIIYGFSARALFSLAAASVAFFSGFLGGFFLSPDYGGGWMFFNWSHGSTWGAFAYALAVWVIGALAGGRNVLAGFSAALLVAVHPIMGAYVTTLLIAVLVLRSVALSELQTEGIIAGFIGGTLVTGLSLAIFLTMQPHDPGDIDLVVYNAYVTLWDYHRTRPFQPAVLLPWIIAATAIGGFLALSKHKQSTPIFLAAVVVAISVTFSAILYLAPHLMRGMLPRPVVAVMPGRFLGVHGSLACAVAIGIAVWIADQLLLPRERWAGTLRGLVAEVAGKARAGRHLFARAATGHFAIGAAPWLILLAYAAWSPIALVGRFSEAADAFKAHLAGIHPLMLNEETFWVAVREAHLTKPVLVSYTASVPAQKLGHLPVLLDVTMIDFVPYHPATAKDVAHIIEKAYGVSFTNPPPELMHLGALREETGRKYWSRITPAQWSDLGRELGFTTVLAPSDWGMSLPVQVAGSKFTLYRVPVSAPNMIHQSGTDQ